MVDYNICRLVPRKPFHRIALLIILLVISINARSQKINVDGLYYYLADDGGNTCSLTSKSTNGIHYSGDIKIPASIEYEGKTYEVTEIISAAFSHCKEVTSVEIPNSVKKIGEGAFLGCKKLTHITLPNGITTIEPITFSNSGLVTFEVPETVTSIGESAFANCYNLQSIVISRSVQSIDEHAFYACIGFTSFTLPSNVTKVGEEAFLGCVGLKSFTVEDDNPVYDSRENCNALIETATNTFIRGCDYSFIPDGVENIAEHALGWCLDIKQITIPNSVKRIGVEAFYECKSLTSLVIPGNVKVIEEGAFTYCEGLSEVTIQNGVEELGNYAFAYCPKIISVSIPKSLKKIGTGVWLGCFGVTSIEVDKGNPVYDSRENCNAIIETASNILVRGCQNSIPANITSLDDYAFAGCNAITTIDIPEGIHIIGESAFYRCENLRTVSLPRSLEYLRQESFGSCLSLESITIPENVIHIGSGSLIGCPSLTSITITTPRWILGNPVFSYEPDVVLHVLPGLKDNYLDYLRYWEYRNFTVIEDASDGIETRKILNEENSLHYNLAGQPVEKGSKGIVIKNGRKVLHL